MRVISGDSSATIERNADLMYQNAEEFIADLRVIPVLKPSRGFPCAYGPVQAYLGSNFGFHLVEMGFRQRTSVHG